MSGAAQSYASPAKAASVSLVQDALKDCRSAFWSVGIFSAVVNLLMLTGSLYMLQVYDRVLSSRSVPTLVALTLLMLGLYAIQAFLDIIRTRVVVRIASLIDQELNATLYRAVVKLAVQHRKGADALQPVRDLDQVRGFLVSPGPVAICDMPWMPFFLLLCFFIHPWIGLASLIGALLLMLLTWLTEIRSKKPMQVVNELHSTRMALADAGRRRSESAVALGMIGNLTTRWMKTNGRYLSAMETSTDVTSSFSSLSKMLRMALQSLVLGVGAYLVIRQEITGGAMIASSIMMGRALAPIETAIGNWRGFVAARHGLARLKDTLGKLHSKPDILPLPKPSQTLSVENIAIAAPHSQKGILIDISFAVKAGEAVGIVGPSAAGKTSLARVLTGIWPVVRGVVRLDGAALEHWDEEERGRHIGYLAQDPDLFEGSIAENIARLAVKPDSDAVLRAAQAAGVHDMILRFPEGYETKLDDGATMLSSGQRQRIALARALYGEPFLVVLDEPNANLDGEGSEALLGAVRNLKTRGAITLIIAHRPAALTDCDKILFLAQGRMQGYGERDEMLRKLAGPAAAQQGNLKVVDGTQGRAGA
jgi:PrtD family type I secretion system ABC transporter